MTTVSLDQLLSHVKVQQTIGAKLLLPIAHLCTDSRQAVPQSLFVAVAGTQTDGHQYIDRAIQQGATAVVCQQLPAHTLPHICYIVVSDSAMALGQIASVFYQHPSRQLYLVGITGTNGKTTTATLLFQLFSQLGYMCGLISTVQYQIGSHIYPSTHTTPDAIRFNELLAEMVEAGCQYVFAEVSSHAVVQERIAGLHFTGGIFTNITHDHLDYHGTFDQYLKAKKRFFDQLPATAFALSNIDDKRGLVMLQNTAARTYTYSLRTLADFKARILENTFAGLLLHIDGQDMHARLIGEFNAYNLLAVYGAARLLHAQSDEVLTALSQLQSAEGRFEYVVQPQTGVVGIVDYAHTPDALDKVIDTINQLRTRNEQLITVVGCGGDRDKTKRPEMARIAAEKSNRTILTSDNPRTEDPNAILADMQVGVPTHRQACVLCIENRREAIKTAVALAQKGDIILVAGKGHEKYQEINGIKHAFDDKAVLASALQLTPSSE